MSRKFLHFVLLAALVAASSLALADPPTLVGRISAAEGRVTVQTDDGEETGSLVNWPVKAGDRITTSAGARTEFRIGPVAVRLDGDSALNIEALDEDVMRLRLDYGTANVRVRDPQALAGFELSTPQGRVLLTEPGSVRVDADREPDTMTVNVLLGTARVEAAGTALTLRTGKRADIRGDDVRTSLSSNDNFDAWTMARDRRDEASIATRYIPSYVTGYEELDNYGSWTVSDDYGPLWTPRAVPVDWAPYRDGRWAWVAPWGWTWVDNAAWGYAPFHYGRWVVVNRRWCWAPGRIVGRPVWSPALVGWVGGSGWEVSFSDRRHAPGFGWYPLTPRDRYVPHYAVSSDYARRLDWQYRHPLKPVQVQREGVTIVPRDQFEAHRVVRVNTLPRASVVPRGGALPVVAAPVVPNGVRIVDRNRDGVPDRQQIDRNRDGIADRMQIDRNRDGVPDRMQIDRNRDGITDRLQTDRNHDGVPDRMQIDRNRDGMPDRPQWRERNVISTERPAGERPRASIVATPAPSAAAVPAPQPALRPAPQPAPSPMPQVVPTPQPTPQPAPSRAFIANERLERQREMNEERAERRREFESRRQAIEAQQAPRPAPQPAPAPAPVVQPRPAPQAAPTPVVQPRQAPQGGEARPQQGGHDRGRGDRGENGRER